MRRQQVKHLVGWHEWRTLQPDGAQRPWRRCDWCGANTEERTMKRLLIRWSTKRCSGCDDPMPHTHHLTRLGQWRYIGRFR